MDGLDVAKDETAEVRTAIESVVTMTHIVKSRKRCCSPLPAYVFREQSWTREFS